MANDFKRICTPDISTSLTTIYAVPAGASSAALESIVIGITMANKTTSGVTASIWIDNEDASNDVWIVKDASIPAGASLEVMSGNKIILEAGDIVKASGSNASGADADVILSIMEIT